jgi:hypothetical protein
LEPNLRTIAATQSVTPAAVQTAPNPHRRPARCKPSIKLDLQRRERSVRPVSRETLN